MTVVINNLLGSAPAGAQPLDSDLTAIAALTTTAAGRALLDDADAAAQRTTLELGALATGDDSADVPFAPGESGLVATDVEAALVELKGLIDALE